MTTCTATTCTRTSMYSIVAIEHGTTQPAYQFHRSTPWTRLRQTRQILFPQNVSPVPHKQQSYLYVLVLIL